MTEPIQCLNCIHANTATAYFCTNCHAMLIRRCPNCWHEQRQGPVCEKSGTCFALAAELTLEHSANEDSRIVRDKSIAREHTVWQIALLPFTSVGSLCARWRCDSPRTY
jgi:hypothetical protein